MSSRNFACTRDGLAATVSIGANAAFALDADAAVAAAAADVMIDNRGTGDCCVRAGKAGVAATALSVRVPANTAVIYHKGIGNTHLAIYGVAATNVVTHIGDGA